MEAVGQSRGGEGRRDLLHLAHEAPRLLGAPCAGLGPGREVGQRARPLADERVVDPFGPSESPNGHEERGAALAPRGVGHLEGRGGAGRPVEEHDLE